MSWLEFITQMSQAWAWPIVASGTIVLLRRQVKAAATALVARVGDIRRLKAPGVDVEFDEKVRELAEAADKLEDEAPKAITASDAQKAVLPPETVEERVSKYQQLAMLEPRAAILLPFADLDSVVRKRFQQLYPAESRTIGFRRMVDILHKDGRIDDGLARVMKSMSELRNSVAHSADQQVDVSTAITFVESIESLANYLQDVLSTDVSAS
jgi:hypothetical protein